MAFGDALRQTDGATVVLNVDTSQTQKLEAAEAQWRDSVGQMSREAIKLDLAQERLKKSLSAYGAESAQAKRATIALKDAEEQATRAASKQEQQTKELTAAQSRQRSGISGLTKGVVGLAGAYVGVHGLVSVVRSSIAAAKEEQLVRGQTGIVLEAAGIAYEQYRERIEAVIRAQSQLGFDDEELLKTFQLFVGRTKDVSEALALNALAVDVARGRYIDLEAASKLVLKASLGQSGALRRLGLDVEKGASSTELLTLLTERYGKAAEAASTTAVAAGDRLGVEWENMKEILGAGLLPAVTDLSDRLADYIGDADNQREVQERVNSAIDTGEQVVRGLAGAFDFLNEMILGPLKSLGLLDEAIQAALILGLVSRARKAAASFGLIASASAVTTGKVVRDSAIAGRALDVAYRPRVVAVSGGGVPAGAGGGRFGGGANVALILAALFGPQFVEKLQKEQSEGERGIGRFFPDYQLWPGGPSLQDLLGGKKAPRVAPPADFRSPDTMDPNRPGVLTPRGGGGGGGGGRPGARTLADILLDQARAQAGGGTGEGFLREERSFHLRKIAALEARKSLTDKQKAALQQLYSQLSSVDSQLAALEEAEEQKLQAQRDRAASKRKAAREKAERQEARETAEEVRRAGRVGQRTGRWGTGRSTAEVARLHAKHARDKQEERGQTAAETRRMIHEFITGLQGVTNQFGSNISPDGGIATNTWVTAQRMLELVHGMDRLSRSVQHPGAKYARTEMSSALGGVGAI